MNLWYIYKITNLLNGKSYVGQKLTDKDPLTDNYMGSGLYVKRSIKKHGLNNFKKEILIDELTSQFGANIFEEYFIKKEDTLSPNGYNLKSSSLQHCIFSKESKKKMSESAKGKIFSEQTRLRLSKAKLGNQNVKGMHHSKVSKDKISKSRKGHLVSKETRLKLSESLKGREVSKETKLKMSKAKLGKETHNKGHKISEETKLKISKALKGKTSPRKGTKLSKETKNKISKARKGVKRGSYKKNN
jgi:group I intron endonuclease